MQPPAHLECCELVRNERDFLMPITIGDQDFFSVLPFDCVKPVFEFMNHDLLDVLSCVSQSMGIFAMSIRPNIMRTPAKSLTIFHEHHGICVNLKIAPGRMDFKRHYKIGKGVKSMPCGAFKCIRNFLDRFNPTQLLVSSAYRHFIEHCKEAFNNHSFNDVHVKHIEIDMAMTPRENRTFIHFIASLCAAEYYLKCDFFNKAFVIQHLMVAMNHLQNCRKLFSFYDKNQLQPLLEKSYDIIPKFENLNLESVVIDAHRLMEIIIKRLELRAGGRLFLNTTKFIDLTILEESLNGNELYSITRDDYDLHFVVQCRHLEWEAKIHKWCIRGCVNGVTVNFVRTA